MRLKNRYSSSLLCICSSLFETNLKKAKYGIYEKLSRVFSVSGSRFEEKCKPPTPVVLTHHFSAAIRTLVFGYLFKIIRFAITFAREVFHLRIKMKKEMTTVLFFSLSPTANYQCECDGKSKKRE